MIKSLSDINYIKDKIYSAFELEKYVYNKNTKIGKWIKELIFYCGDFTNVDFKNDWRFKEVKDKRKQLKFLGTKKKLVFPIIYPLILDNGFIINEYEKLYYDEEIE